MVSLWAIAVQLHNYAGPLVILVYPLYASVAAIESPFKEDDTQWLTYWVLYSFFQLIELSLERILNWLPFWYSAKLLGICWLVLPQFHGAAYVYENYVKRCIIGVSARRNEKWTSQQRQVIQQMSPRARACVSAFIAEHGSGAFDSLMSTITVEAKRATFTNRETRSPRPAQPVRYPMSSPGTGGSFYTGSPPAAEPTEFTGSPTSRAHSGYRRSDSIREYCKQPVKLVKTGLHSLESRRNEIRAKMRTNFIT